VPFTTRQCEKDVSHLVGKKRTLYQYQKYILFEADLRPISLTATLGKVLESFVRAWILERVGSTLDDRQYGALKQRSTTHALVDMLHHWHAAVDNGQSVRTVFVDFAKAFDHVDHNVLVSKLVALDLPDVIVRWICAFL